jgi:hypothetical protein
MGAACAGLSVGTREVAAEVLPCVHELEYEAFGGLILVKVGLNESPFLDFVLDSGATHSTVNDPLLATMLGLEIEDAGLARGLGAGAIRVNVVGDTSIRARDGEILRIPLVVRDIVDRLAAHSGRDIFGFLGGELFERYVVEIDPVLRRIRLYEPGDYSYQGDGVILPLEIDDRRATIEGRVVVDDGKPIPVKLLLDTGSSRYLMLIDGSRRRLKPPEVTGGTTSVGVVGNTALTTARTARLELGSIVAADLDTTWVKPPQIPAGRNIDKLNGVIGNGLLSRFRVIVDIRRGQCIFESPSGLSDAMHGKPD